MYQGQAGQAGSSSLSYQGSTPTPPMESPISQELNLLTQQIAELEQEVNALHARLAPVSLPQAPAVAGGNGANKEMGRGVVADAIQSSARRVALVNQQISYITGNLSV